ncbi:RNHCP domain-containing protein [Candidatus Peregrinibacteria bacterium CG10_big_fil_rev_8_21_14_0_10_49_16]|nr:MAG: RNHCP domain-containing protein [Candidatus Peregrinibacteria bacterium CG22_combo_CG10-13_8_21_14_all_49_11]PIR51752.1 MAG: RNHCP domain-containing protein [Candidatus Peregrinibacteria bacterium CG10_big_fil_rev_8_21_14_0_10_49_16]
MVFIAQQEPFTCEHCHSPVTPLPRSYRNHCPKCLYSKHVDDSGPGSRDAACHGLMKPTGIDGQAGSGFVVMHECVTCGKLERNKAAEDDDLTLASST